MIVTYRCITVMTYASRFESKIRVASTLWPTAALNNSNVISTFKWSTYCFECFDFPPHFELLFVYICCGNQIKANFYWIACFIFHWTISCGGHCTTKYGIHTWISWNHDHEIFQGRNDRWTKILISCIFQDRQFNFVIRLCNILFF